MRKENGEIKNNPLIVFGVSLDSLLLLNLFKRDIHYPYPLDIPFREIFKDLRNFWSEEPFLDINIQNPETIEPILNGFYEYHLLPVPEKSLIDKKRTLANKFCRYIENRITKSFPGTQIKYIEPNLDAWIYDASTGEIIPPYGLRRLEEMPLDIQKYVYKMQKHENNRKDITKIKTSFPVHSIICECCGDVIPCPICDRTDLLRGWNSSGRTIALCYYCGTLFYADNDEIISRFDGKREIWGARALTFIGKSIVK